MGVWGAGHALVCVLPVVPAPSRTLCVVKLCGLQGPRGPDVHSKPRLFCRAVQTGLRGRGRGNGLQGPGSSWPHCPLTMAVTEWRPAERSAGRYSAQ